MSDPESKTGAHAHSSPETSWTEAFQDLPLDALPAEFWDHLGRALEEVGRALRILARHVGGTTDVERLYNAYDRVMRERTHVGPPPQASE